MFYLLHICSCLIVCSEIPFSESLCFTGTSQLVSAVFDLSRFCLVWLFTHFNLWTHFRAIFVLCAHIDEPAFAIISQPYVFLQLMFWVIKRVSIYLLSMPVSLAQWRGEKGAFYNNTLALYKISIFYFLLSLSYGSLFCASNYKFNFKRDNAFSF